MRRLLSLCFLVSLLSACASGNDLDEAPVELGNFQFGHNVVVALDPHSSVISRKVDKDILISSMKEAMAARFERYEGDALYHTSVVIDQYELAPPGVPVVASPRSGMVIRVTAWDDAAGGKLNAEPHRIIIIESTSGKTLLGSGLTQTKEEQVQSLTRSAAKQIELWFVKQMNEEGWFMSKEGATAASDTPSLDPSAIVTPETPTDG